MKTTFIVVLSLLMSTTGLASGYQDGRGDTNIYNRNNNSFSPRNNVRNDINNRFSPRNNVRSDSRADANANSSASAAGGSAYSSSNYDNGYYYPPSLNVVPSNNTAPNQTAKSIGISTPFGGIGTAWSKPDTMSWAVTAIQVSKDVNDPELQRLGVELLKQELQEMKTPPKNKPAPSNSTSASYLGGFQ